jgi:hypothetical protein
MAPILSGRGIACVLYGFESLVDLETYIDIHQEITPGHTVGEALAEILGNEIGREMGHQMNRFLEDNIDAFELRQRLINLCE